MLKLRVNNDVGSWYPEMRQVLEAHLKPQHHEMALESTQVKRVAKLLACMSSDLSEGNLLDV